MRRPRSVAAATWMLEHLACGPYTEALVGDLLEGLEFGRSAGWYWRQAICAMAFGTGVKARTLAEPLLFSVCWGGVYPAWSVLIVKAPLTQVAVARWTALDLPYAASLKVIGEISPAAAFLWAGLFAYLLCHKDLARAVSRVRVVCGLSIGLNVLLVLTLTLSHVLSRAEGGFGDAMQNAFSQTHFLGLSVLLAISLFAVIPAVLPGQRAHTTSAATH